MAMHNHKNKNINSYLDHFIMVRVIRMVELEPLPSAEGTRQE